MVISPETRPIMYAGGEINCTANMDDWPIAAAEFMADEDGTHYIMSASTQHRGSTLRSASTRVRTLPSAVDWTTQRPTAWNIEYAVTGTATVTE